MPISELFPLRFSDGGKRASPRGSSRRARMRRAEAKREARSQNQHNSYYEVSAE
ncbi:hypothetical protein J051_0049 [Klebsiella pneumoniae 440_1540]|nr:hypothetical protein J051_0049 [Klebsiella pneumoniae 440_1540]EPB04298.1 hypothetical protein H210_0011 [Klebsiella pneumoniae UHKPC05]